LQVLPVFGRAGAVVLVEEDVRGGMPRAERITERLDDALGATSAAYRFIVARCSINFCL